MTRRLMMRRQKITRAMQRVWLSLKRVDDPQSQNKQVSKSDFVEIWKAARREQERYDLRIHRSSSS